MIFCNTAIWSDYVQRMVSRKGDLKRYPLEQTHAWLRWLAREMRLQNQTVFSLEQLQLDCLPKTQRALYQWSTGLLFGLAGGLDKTIEPAEALTWSWKDLRDRLLAGLRTGLTFGLLGGLIGLLRWLTSGLLGGLLAWLIDGLLTNPRFGLESGLIFSLLYGLASGLSRTQLTERLMLSPNEGIRRSMNNGCSSACSSAYSVACSSACLATCSSACPLACLLACSSD